LADGERAFRYFNHDVGHALAALRFAANLFGWQLTCLTGLSDAAVETVLGLRRTDYPSLDEEHPDLLCLVLAGGQHSIPQTLPAELIAAFDKIHFAGRPNPLSLYHFTVGHPLEDPRLTTLPPYSHLRDR
jgi:hypothetical protein